MFIDHRQYPFLMKISENIQVVRDELRIALSTCRDVSKVLDVEMTVDFHSDQWTKDNGINRDAVGYDLRNGGYSMLTIYKKGHDLAALGDQKPFAKTLQLLQNIEGLHYASFTALSPGAHLGLHAHTRHHLICHFLMNDLIGGACEMICDGHVAMLEKAGDMALFDYSLPHETYSHARNTRINLMIDFKP